MKQELDESSRFLFVFPSCHAFVILFFFAVAVAPAWGQERPASRALLQPRGPSDLPDKLEGPCKVTLCVNVIHSWLVFQNLQTGEMHTLGNYGKGRGEWWCTPSGLKIPSTGVDGVHLDRELNFLYGRVDTYVQQSALVRDPKIFRGKNNGFGFNLYFNNCTSFARDAWHYYTGEWYSLPGIPLPTVLRVEMWNRHPEVRAAALR